MVSLYECTNFPAMFPVVFEWCRARDFSVRSKAKKISIGGHLNLYHSLPPSLRISEKFGGKFRIKEMKF